MRSCAGFKIAQKRCGETEASGTEARKGKGRAGKRQDGMEQEGCTVTVKTGDTLYGVHESFFYAGKASPRKQYKVTQETVTRVFSDGNVRTEYYMDGYRRIGDYMPRDFGKHIFIRQGKTSVLITRA